jgi:hypothetical protein
MNVDIEEDCLHIVVLDDSVRSIQGLIPWLTKRFGPPIDYGLAKQDMSARWFFRYRTLFFRNKNDYLIFLMKFSS